MTAFPPPAVGDGLGLPVPRTASSTLSEAPASLSFSRAALVTGNAAPSANPERLGKLAVFDGVRNYPARVKCASLAWHTLRSAVDATDEVVSTEAE